MHEPAPPTPADRLAANNAIKTVGLVGLLLAVTAAVGYLLVGFSGLVVGALVVLAVTVFGFRVSPRWIMRMQRGIPLSPADAPELNDIVSDLSARAHISQPHLFVIPGAAPNAMAAGWGSDRAALAVTTGALEILDAEELEGILAHEVAHLKNGDTTLLRAVGIVSSAVMTILRVAMWIGLVTLLLYGPFAPNVMGLLALAFFAPFVVAGLQAALARTREFAADQMAVELTGKPWALAKALSKVERRIGWLEVMLGGPLRPTMMRTHPAVKERIARLSAIAAS